MLHSTNDPIIIMEEVCKQAELSLNETPKLLPALAKAGVVDLQAARDFSLSLKQ